MTADRLTHAISFTETAVEDLRYEDAAHILFTIPTLFSLRGEISIDQNAEIQYLMGQVLFPNNKIIYHPSNEQMGRAIEFMRLVNDQNLDYTSLETLLLFQMDRLSTKYPDNVDQLRFMNAVNGIREIFAQPK